ncbi:MAG: site-specific integrase, partial [Eubacterium sp.]|nr:site-specific integrase [Eubacterium sp.]
MANIEKRGENKYRLTVCDGFKPDGRRNYIRKTVEAKSEREAKRLLALFVSEVESKHITADSSMKFKDFVKLWEGNYAATNLEARTYVRYMELLNANILPELGEKKLSEITPVDLLNFYNSLTHDGARKDGKPGGYSAKTIQHIHRLISSIYNKAAEWQIIGYNPARGIKPPKVVKKEIDFYSEEDVKTLISALEGEPIRQKTMTLLAVFTGMRRSEILGLKWENIDFENKTIEINSAAVYASGKGRIDKGTKTTRSNRIISMSETVEKLMLEYKNYQEEMKALLANKWKNSDSVFTNDFGEKLHPDSISQWFRKFIKRKHLKHISFHGLRHTTATLLLSTGTDIETVSRIIGHSNYVITSQTNFHSANA